MATVEKTLFETRIPELMPLILKQFDLNEGSCKPGRYVLLKSEETNEEVTEKLRLRDHHLFQMLQMLLKISSQCPKFLKRTADIEKISVHVQGLLSYPHEWVRLSANQFLGKSSNVSRMSVCCIKCFRFRVIITEY